MDQVNTIIWDWNGTLLNDTDICVETINCLLEDRGLPQINRKKYLENFGFPVIDYYRRIGFDFNVEPFDIPAMQYINLYTQKVEKCRLHEATLPVLNFFYSKGFNQLLLSASEVGILQTSISHFKIANFFNGLAGLDNHFATSKTEIGVQMLNSHHIKPNNACLIGDTIHDFEVAQVMGCHCILVADGHQPLSKLMETGALVVEKLNEVRSIFGKLPLFNIPDK